MIKNIFHRKKYLYFITTFYFNGKTLERPRTIGFLSNFNKAENVIKYNEMDICECNYYNIALIEKVQECLYPEICGTEKFWYEIHEIKKNKGFNYFEYSYNKLNNFPKEFNDIHKVFFYNY